MRMDATCVRALNVMRQKTDPNDNFSLYGLMNKVRAVCVIMPLVYMRVVIKQS